MTWGVADQQIVLSLQGGLGNQLFQWAFARELAYEGRTVFFDTVRCRGDRPYALGDLVPDRSRLGKMRGATLALAQRFGWINERSRLRLVKQRRSGYDPTIRANLAGASYLMGYFQSPMYFAEASEDVRDTIRDHVGGMLTSEGRRFLHDLQSDPFSIAVHVRRGDYLTVPSATERHGVLDKGYYDRALALMDERGYSHRVWFSDDPEWVREHLARPGDRVCPAGLTTQDGGEIALMASCAARVIANSSFSWWAGWLGSPSTIEQPVVAPVVWFAGGHSDASDLVPAEWVRV